MVQFLTNFHYTLGCRATVCLDVHVAACTCTLKVMEGWIIWVVGEFI